MALDEPEEDDEVNTINNIQVAIDERIADMVMDLTIEKQTHGLVLTGMPQGDC